MKITSTPAFGNKALKPSVLEGSLEAAKQKLAGLGVSAQQADNYLKRVAPESGITTRLGAKTYHTPQSKLLFDITDALVRDGRRIAANIMKSF